MIIYVDTSALVPLLIAEPTSAVCGDVWDGADRAVCTRLAYVEAVAAMVQAEQQRRISMDELRAGRTVLDDLWPVVDVLELDEPLMREAARLAAAHGLRGYDATHCAAAVTMRDQDLVAISGDADVLAAWRAEGLAVLDTNA